VPKLILSLLFMVSYSSSFAHAKEGRSVPKTVQEFNIVYYDYDADKDFNFSKPSDAQFEELESYISSEIDEINNALNLPDSKLRASMVGQNVDTFLIEIYPQEVVQSCDGPFPPYFDDRQLGFCAVRSIIYIYGKNACGSKSEDYLGVAKNEFENPTCPFESRGSKKKHHKALFSFSTYLKPK
jgi:hypothetical protein